MFLKSLEFFDLLGSRSTFLLEQSFKRVQQFQEVGHPSTVTPLDFLDLQKFSKNIIDNKMQIEENVGQICPFLLM